MWRRKHPGVVRRTTPVRVELLTAAAADRMRDIVGATAEVIAYGDCINLEYRNGGGGLVIAARLLYTRLPIDEALRDDLTAFGDAAQDALAAPALLDGVVVDRPVANAKLTETEALVWYGDGRYDATEAASRWRPIALAEIGL